MDENTEEDIRVELPEVWKDDQRMDVLFSPFRDNREINPNSWDTKHKFWSKLITQFCRKSRTLVFDTKTLHLKFKRKGKMPVCLRQVLCDMASSQKIVSVENYRKSLSAGWLSWGFNTFVKKPVSWSLGAVVGSNQTSDLEDDFIHPELVEEKAEELLITLQKQVKHVATDYLLYFTQVKTRASSICEDEASLDLIVMLLAKHKKVVVSETQKGEKVLKFVSPEEKRVSAITEIELGILRLQKTKTLLQSETEKLAEEIQRCVHDAKYYLAKGLRNSAKNALRRKKTVEKKLDQKECSLQVLSGLLEKIQDAESEKMILDAYQAGTAAMKQNMKDGLDIDRVEQTLDAVQEVIENQADITQVLSTSISEPTLDVSDSDLLSELDDLLVGEPEVDDLTAKLGEFNIDTLPDVPNTSLKASTSDKVLNTTFTMDGQSPKTTPISE